MLILGCGQYLRNPFFPGFWSQKWGCGFCILADYTQLYTVGSFIAIDNREKSRDCPSSSNNPVVSYNRRSYN